MPYRTEDLAYHHAASGPLLARLYRPSTVPIAALVSVHGGRWVAESRLTNAVIDEALAEAGVLAMAIDFRMPPEVRYPDPVADINHAIRWLKREAPRLGVDPARVGGIGTSSGGHQLMLNVLRPDDQRYAAHRLIRDENASLAFVVACWAVLDPLARFRMAQERQMERHLEAHAAYWPDETAMAEGNPQRMLDDGDHGPLPPLLLIQGEADQVLTADMTRRFARSYAAAGGEVTLRTFAEQPHTFITKSPKHPASRAATEEIASFIRKLYGAREPHKD